MVETRSTTKRAKKALEAELVKLEKLYSAYEQHYIVAVALNPFAPPPPHLAAMETIDRMHQEALRQLLSFPQ